MIKETAYLYPLVSLRWADAGVEQTGWIKQEVLTLPPGAAEGVLLQGGEGVSWAGEHGALGGLADEAAVAVKR